MAEPGPSVIVVAGPTASGKSALAMAIAAAFDGVIINADSQQRYRQLPILTAQPAPEDMARVPHKLFGDFAVEENGSAAEWALRAAHEIQSAVDAKKCPIIAGGTGLYLRALMDGLADIPEIPVEIRDEARTLMGAIGNAAFHARLGERDPGSAGRIAAGDTQRLLRAWEVLEATDTPLRAWQKQPTAPPLAARYFKILLLPPRAELNAACDARLRAMVAAGALAEVRSLVESGVARDAAIFRALGARELAAHLAGESSLEAAVAAAQGATRRYVKRQITWYKYQFSADFTVYTKFYERLVDEIFPNIRHFLLT